MAARAAKTKYVILRAADQAGFWEQLTGEYQGDGTEEAIKTAKETVGPEQDARFVAIPASTWRPAKVRTEVTSKTTVDFEKPARRRRPAEEPVTA